MKHFSVCVRSWILMMLMGVFTSCWSQELPQAEKNIYDFSASSLLVSRFSDHDVFLTLSSIEWGSPDRWSFTARYIHQFDKDRDHRTQFNSAIISLSPGISGLRLGMGYQGIFTLWGKVGIISELRGVLLRTWGHPLIAESKHNYGGAEIRCSLTAVLNISAGYYSPLSNTDNLDPFWGFHLGIGM